MLFTINKATAFFICFFTVAAVVAQPTTKLHTNLLWFNYNNAIQLNHKWGMVNDVQVRSRDWANRWSQFGIRTGAVYAINNRLSVAGGIAWFGNVRYFNNDPTVANEWRAWEELSYKNSGGKSTFIQRIRLEQRFLQMVFAGHKSNEYEKRQRFRYRFEWAIPLNNKKMELHAGNEVMVNLNYISERRFFDQNRSFVFINYKLSPVVFIQFQYIKIFLWQGLIKVMDNQNIFRFSIHHQINRRSFHT